MNRRFGACLAHHVHPFNSIRHIAPTTTDDARCGDARDGAFVDVTM
jgi:hypothetical protein